MLYYTVIESAAGELLSVLRSIIERDPPSVALAGFCACRVIVDYMFTVPTARGAGHAARLLNFVQNLAQTLQGNVYVLALEESSPFFVDRAFVLEASEGLQARLNVFPDTHLLAWSQNMLPERFTAESAAAAAGEDMDEENGDEPDEDDEDQEDEDDDEEEQREEEEEEENEDDAALQQALAISRTPLPRYDDGDSELHRVLALSRDPAASAVAAGEVIDLTGEDDEEAMLQQAMTMSRVPALAVMEEDEEALLQRALEMSRGPK